MDGRPGDWRDRQRAACRVEARKRWKRLPVSLFVSTLLGAGVVAAEPSAQEKAAAEVLFQSGASLIEQQRFAEACEKFDASYTLDPAVGTRLRLADCYDRMGRTASAWALFMEVATMARSQGQTERENIASVRAKDLEKRLSRLVIRIDPADVPVGSKVMLNGTTIPQASWNVPIPVDPGRQSVQVSAPDHAPWSNEIEVPVGPSERAMEVPSLRPLPAESTLDPTLQSPPMTTVRRAGPHPLTWVGYVTGGAGVIGLGVAGFFGYRAYDNNEDSLGHCSNSNANACTPRGKALRDDAQRFATVSTVSAIAGSVLLATGITLLVVAPSEKTPQTSMVREVRINPLAGTDTAGIAIEGELF